MKIILTAICIISSPLLAGQKGFYVDTALATGYNPLAAKASAAAYHRIPLSSDNGILWRNTKADFGVSIAATPVDYAVSGFAAVEPVAFFDVRFYGTYSRYYTNLGYGYYPMTSEDSSYSQKSLDRIDPETKSAIKFSAEPTLKFMLGRVIFADTAGVTFIKINDDDGYYYEAYSDTIHKTKDRSYSNSFSVLYKFNDYFKAGLNDYGQMVSSSGYKSNRVAALLLFNRQFEKNEVTAAFLSGSYTKNRYYKHKLFAAFYVGNTFKFR